MRCMLVVASASLSICFFFQGSSQITEVGGREMCEEGVLLGDELRYVDE